MGYDKDNVNKAEQLVGPIREDQLSGALEFAKGKVMKKNEIIILTTGFAHKDRNFREKIVNILDNVIKSLEFFDVINFINYN